MLVIESCILNSKLLPYAEKLGYNLVFSEDGVAGIKRVTLKGINTNYLKKQINRLKSKNVLIFIKPLTLDSLKYAIVNKGVNAIVLDDDNVRIFKKTMLNLIRINDKFVEIPLKSSINTIYFGITIAYKWAPNIIFSSCANEFNELWSPISKIDYLTVLGADEEEVYKFVLFNPMKLLYEFNSTNL